MLRHKAQDERVIGTIDAARAFGGKAIILIGFNEEGGESVFEDLNKVFHSFRSANAMPFTRSYEAIYYVQGGFIAPKLHPNLSTKRHSKRMGFITQYFNNPELILFDCWV